MAERMQALGRAHEYHCPQLPASPAAAIRLALDYAQRGSLPELTIVGSSLGGFYATWLAEQLGCRAVLLNPAVKPPRDLESYVGVSTQYHSAEPFEFKRDYIDEIKALLVERITLPQRYFLIAATGDEVLDWRDMVAHYPGAQQTVIQGSDHGIAEFAEHADAVLRFCGIAPLPAAAGALS
jgi:predicted esterase YcpF (UPF0227 family)